MIKWKHRNLKIHFIENYCAVCYSLKQNISPTQMDGETVEISEERVRKAVRELKNGKSCGPEGVHVEMLKHGTDKLTKMLTWVINRFLNGEETQQQWQVAYISSIHKKGSKKDC